MRPYHRLAMLCLTVLLAACQAGRSPAPTATPTAAPTIAPTMTPLPTATALPEDDVVNPSDYDERADTITIESAVLGTEKTFFVYTPPGYDPDGEARLPVLYLFRGHEREWINTSEDDSRQGNNVLDVYEELLAAGRVGPMILVFPGISSDDNSVTGMLTNFEEPEEAKGEEGVGTGRFEDYFIQEVIPYVDEHYRTIADRVGRGVDGFSLGGFMSTKIALQHPDMFETVGAFDGLYFYTTPDCELDDPRDTVFDMSLFDPAFGEPRDLTYAAENNAPTLVCAMDGAALQELTWLIQYGPEVLEPNSANYYRGAHLMEQLKAKGVTSLVNPILNGGHKWRTADDHMRQTLPIHWATLSAEAP